MTSTQPSTQKPNFDVFWQKNCKKSAVKHSIEKPILFNFVNLTPTFCPRLSEETGCHLFSFVTRSRPLDFTFSEEFNI